MHFWLRTYYNISMTTLDKVTSSISLSLAPVFTACQQFHTLDYTWICVRFEKSVKPSCCGARTHILSVFVCCFHWKFPVQVSGVWSMSMSIWRDHLIYRMEICEAPALWRWNIVACTKEIDCIAAMIKLFLTPVCYCWLLGARQNGCAPI